MKLINLDEARRIWPDPDDADRFQFLQNIPPIQAQAFFWNYSSRRDRKRAIDDAMREARLRTFSVAQSNNEPSPHSLSYTEAPHPLGPLHPERDTPPSTRTG